MIKNQKAGIHKILLPLAFAILLTTAARSQYVSLNRNEIDKLSSLIKKDQAAKKVYVALETLAASSLVQEPNPIDTIISEGHLATDPKKIITQKSLADMNKSYALAFVYKIDHNTAYLKKCIQYLIAWANVNHGVGNPINDTKLDPIIEAYDLVKDEMTTAERKTVDGWLRQVADAEIAAPRFKSTNKSANNNWNSHRIKVVGNVAYILNNTEYKQFTDTSIQKQILKNLYSDGSGMDLEERDALHYHIYTLEPLLKIVAVIKRATGTDYYGYVSPSGSSIQKSVAFLAPFATGEKVHHEFVNSKVLFDKQRAENKEPGYTIGAEFKPQTSVDVFSYASYFEPGYSVIVKKLLNTTEEYANWQLLLNAVRNK
ncbi:MAG: alginate lyase family protein [Bacteroidota bacterium]